jgi:hypothetical protein
MVLLAKAFLGPRDGDLVMAGEGLHPVAGIVGALAQHLLADHGNSQDLPETMDHVLRPGQAAEVTVDDDTVEAVVYKDQQAGEQLCEQCHLSSILRSCFDNSIIGPATSGIEISNMFG